MKILDADVKRPLASVSATLSTGNMVVVGPQESCIEDTSIGQRIPMSQEECSVCCAQGRTSVFENGENEKFDEHAGFQAPA